MTCTSCWFDSHGGCVVGCATCHGEGEVVELFKPEMSETAEWWNGRRGEMCTWLRLNDIEPRLVSINAPLYIEDGHICFLGYVSDEEQPSQRIWHGSDGPLMEDKRIPIKVEWPGWNDEKENTDG